jgi:hypothetical protein
MRSGPVPIEVPELSLRSCSVEEHCESLIRLKRLSYWWYQGISKVLGNYSLPFKDRNGNWWYQVKPGLCWSVDAFKAFEPSQACPPFAKAYFGYQHLVPNGSQANSRLVLNTIFDLTDYGPVKLSSKRRNKIRNGLKNCMLERLISPDKKTFDECRATWDDLSARTGWKQVAKETIFDEEWRMLLDCPGVSIIVARHKMSGRIAGFMITKIIGDTAYSDTVAARTDMLHTRVNDALRYSFLANAMKLPGVRKAHSAIKSSIKGLEDFKRDLGYEPYQFPANTHLRLGLRGVLRLVFPEKYNRMIGRFVDDGIYSVDSK